MIAAGLSARCQLTNLATMLKKPLTRHTSADERQFLEAMAEGHGPDRHAAKRAKFILALLDSADVGTARQQTGMDSAGARRWIEAYNTDGWKGLLGIQSPRGGDFLARYDNDYWAERLVTNAFNTNTEYRAIPYGTSRSHSPTRQRSDNML